VTYANTPLKEQLLTLNNKVSLSCKTPDETFQHLEALIELVDQAVAKKDFHFLGLCVQLPQKLNAPCFAYLEQRPDLAERYMEHFKLDAHVFTPFLAGSYLTLPHDQGDALLTQMIENVLKHESYFDPERARVAEQLLEAVLGSARIVEPVIALCKAIVLTNTDKFCGAGFLIRALAGAKDEQSSNLGYMDMLVGLASNNGIDVDFLRASMAELRSKEENVNQVNQAVITWTRENQQSIADSLLAGPATEWITESTVKSAQAMGLATIAGALAIRSYEFSFELMSAFYTGQGVLSDERHLHRAMSLPAHEPDILAFSLVHENIQGDMEFGQDLVKVIESALDKIGNMPLNLLSIHTVVGKLVAQMDVKSDVSTLTNSRLGPHLRGFRKFNGMRLENELGL
jgi:hypothetical protein